MVCKGLDGGVPRPPLHAQTVPTPHRSGEHHGLLHHETDIAGDGYYIGATYLAAPFSGTLSADPDLGRIKFRHPLNVTGDIVFGERTGLQVDGSISCGGLLKVGCGIIAIENIASERGIYAGRAYSP